MASWRIVAILGIAPGFLVEILVVRCVPFVRPLVIDPAPCVIGRAIPRSTPWPAGALLIPAEVLGHLTMLDVSPVSFTSNLLIAGAIPNKIILFRTRRTEPAVLITPLALKIAIVQFRRSIGRARPNFIPTPPSLVILPPINLALISTYPIRIDVQIITGDSLITVTVLLFPITPPIPTAFTIRSQASPLCWPGTITTTLVVTVVSFVKIVQVFNLVV